MAGPMHDGMCFDQVLLERRSVGVFHGSKLRDLLGPNVASQFAGNPSLALSILPGIESSCQCESTTRIDKRNAIDDQRLLSRQASSDNVVKESARFDRSSTLNATADRIVLYRKQPIPTYLRKQSPWHGMHWQPRSRYRRPHSLPHRSTVD